MSKKIELLGREIRIPADAIIYSGIKKVVFGEKTYEILIGIGDHNIATLFIGEEALKELKNENNELKIETYVCKCKNCSCGK